MALALGAAVCVLVAPKEARHLRKAAAAAYLTAAVLATAVCAMGTYVASIKGFPESAPPARDLGRPLVTRE